MKHRKYLNATEVMILWDTYNKSFSYGEASSTVGVVNSTGYHWIKDIQALLAGEKVERSRGGDVLRQVFKNIKQENALAANSGLHSMSLSADEENLTTVQTQPQTNGFKASNLAEMTAEERVNFLFAELKKAIAELALEMANERNKEILEQAKSSNVIGMIKRGWSTSII